MPRRRASCAAAATKRRKSFAPAASAGRAARPPSPAARPRAQGGPPSGSWRPRSSCCSLPRPCCYAPCRRRPSPPPRRRNRPLRPPRRQLPQCRSRRPRMPPIPAGRTVRGSASPPVPRRCRPTHRQPPSPTPPSLRRPRPRQGLRKRVAPCRRPRPRRPCSRPLRCHRPPRLPRTPNPPPPRPRRPPRPAPGRERARNGPRRPRGRSGPPERARGRRRASPGRRGRPPRTRPRTSQRKPCPRSRPRRSCPGVSAMTEARWSPSSRRLRGRWTAPVGAMACAAAMLAALCDGAWATRALAPAPPSERAASTDARLAGAGIDIVRMPTGPAPAVVPVPVTPASPQPAPVPARPQPASPAPAPSAPIRPAQVGRLVKLPVKVGSLSSDGQKGWLGIKMDPVELPLALSLGLVNANGVFIVETTVAGPAALAGARFGDIITAYDNRPVDGMNDLRQRVSATTPGDQVMLDVWRIAGEDGDFLQALRRLGEGGNAYVMYRLGRMYATGIGVARDENEAVRWYRKGSVAGNMQATAALAIALLEGRGIGKDPQEAIHLLKLAADKDNVEAMYRLGVLYAQGAVVAKD